MKRNLIYLPVILVAANFIPFNTQNACAESDAFAQLSFTGFSITPDVPGSVVLTSLQGMAFGVASANTQSDSGVAPSVNVAGNFSTAQVSATTPGTLALNVNGMSSVSAEVPTSVAGLDEATGRSDVTGQFMITGGTGAVSTTFNVPFAGFLIGETDVAGQSATSETLLSLEVNGNMILTDDRMSAIAANDHYGQTFLTETQQSVVLNYNQVYTFDLEAEATTTVNNVNVPEPGADLMLIGGLGLLGGIRLSKRRLG